LYRPSYLHITPWADDNAAGIQREAGGSPSFSIFQMTMKNESGLAFAALRAFTYFNRAVILLA
jgi:hypothetical protein